MASPTHLFCYAAKGIDCSYFSEELATIDMDFSLWIGALDLLHASHVTQSKLVNNPVLLQL